MSCSFCSVTAFNGTRYRQRPIADVVREFRLIREVAVLVVDDNLIGTRPEHIARAKDLFGAMIDADLRKQWIGQVTINFADDEELLTLAARAGCRGVFIGFESPDAGRAPGARQEVQPPWRRDIPRLRAAHPAAQDPGRRARSSSAWTSTDRASAGASPRRPAGTAWTCSTRCS